ncbi:MAG: hypothetical protein RL531_864 [Actinomycetota bacterium]|jgi:hypothetical protein
MPGLLIILAGVLVGGALALAAALRRARDEVAPTVTAFAEFRSALAPGLLGLRQDALATSARIEAGRVGPDPGGR